MSIAKVLGARSVVSRLFLFFFLLQRIPGMGIPEEEKKTLQKSRSEKNKEAKRRMPFSYGARGTRDEEVNSLVRQTVERYLSEKKMGGKANHNF